MGDSRFILPEPCLVVIFKSIADKKKTAAFKNDLSLYTEYSLHTIVTIIIRYKSGFNDRAKRVRAPIRVPRPNVIKVKFL